MILVLVRHAIAEDRDIFADTGLPDNKRPLTPQGIKKFEKTARKIKKLVPKIGVLYSSPLKRAKQTGKILRKHYPHKTQITPALKPENTPEATTDWLSRHTTRKISLWVGHEPHLSRWASYLLSGSKRSLIKLKKGGALAIEFEGDVEAGKGKLLWLFKP
ncbi:histidine phosphatase family protein [bacterium]|nr:histidine phosphatase family protein [bacterium]